MLKWDVVRCCDHHFRRAIYGLGPYIADYPEQAVAAGTVYNWCVTYVRFLTVRKFNMLTKSLKL